MTIIRIPILHTNLIYIDLYYFYIDASPPFTYESL